MLPRFHLIVADIAQSLAVIGQKGKLRVLIDRLYVVRMRRFPTASVLRAFFAEVLCSTQYFLPPRFMFDALVMLIARHLYLTF
jgi:hypothetical protein